MSEKKKYLQGTVMQLLACAIIKMNILQDTWQAICTLNVVDGTEPSYLQDISWSNMYLIE